MYGNGELKGDMLARPLLGAGRHTGAGPWCRTVPGLINAGLYDTEASSPRDGDEFGAIPQCDINGPELAIVLTRASVQTASGPRNEDVQRRKWQGNPTNLCFSDVLMSIRLCRWRAILRVSRILLIQLNPFISVEKPCWRRSISSIRDGRYCGPAAGSRASCLRWRPSASSGGSTHRQHM